MHFTGSLLRTSNEGDVASIDRMGEGYKSGDQPKAGVVWLWRMADGGWRMLAIGNSLLPVKRSQSKVDDDGVDHSGCRGTRQINGVRSREGNPNAALAVHLGFAKQAQVGVGLC